MAPNWKTNYWSKPIIVKNQRKNRCDICGGFLDYDLDGNRTCSHCGYVDFPCPSCGSYNTASTRHFPFNRICKDCDRVFIV